MPELRLALAVTAAAIPFVAAVVVWRLSRPRTIAAAAAGMSLICTLTALWWLPKASGGLIAIDVLSAAPTAVTTALVLVMLASAPSRDADGRFCSTLLLLLSGTLLVYMAANLFVLATGWLITAAPFLVPDPNRAGPKALHRRLGFTQGVSAVLLSMAVLLIGNLDLHSASTNTASSTSLLAFALATAAALIRAGVFPFHSWVISGFDRHNLLISSAVLSTQTGAFLIARLAVLLPEQAQVALPFLSDLALFSSLILAFLAIGESKPARLLALIAASQSGFVVAGLENRNVAGITGALVHWLVLSSATVGLALVLRAVQARAGDAIDERFAGLGARAPRLAVFFLIFALALVGLPGTLGFPADDLLFHGALEAHPALGLALPVATALTAIVLFRCFAYIFLGKRRIHVVPVRDALARERFALTLIAGFLVIGGFLPNLWVNSRAGAARVISSALADNTAAQPASNDLHAHR